MATIALFSGQGSQYEKMGLDLVQQDAALEEIFEVASEVLGFDLYAVIADSDAQTLAHTIYAQPAIMATSLICLEAAKKRGFTYDAVAGHSLGEYAAMVASGMLSLEDGFRVIKARSEAMDAAAKAADGAMCAILKLAPAEVERICQETEGYVIPANYNSSVQTVIAGDRDAVEKAAAACAALKARAVPLAVASAFHTKLMQPLLRRCPSTPTCWVLSGRTSLICPRLWRNTSFLRYASPTNWQPCRQPALTPLWNSVPRAFSPDWSRKPSRA